VRTGAFAEHALIERLRSETVSPEDRALATELIYGVLRWRDRLDTIVHRCLNRPNKRIQADVREILRIALYQMVLLDRIPAHAAIDQAAIQTRSRCGNQLVGFVNAVLRNALRNIRAVDFPPENDAISLAAFFSHPVWLVQDWLHRFGPETTRKFLGWNNTPAPLELRVNTLKSSTEEIIGILERRSVRYQRIAGMNEAVKILSLRNPVSALEGYAEGLFAVQGSMSQAIAPLLKARPGDHILDACAAPGGKTAHLAALLGNNARITATDADRVRLEAARENVKRLGVEHTRIVRGDVTSPEFIASLGMFDRILVDAACSNLGVLRHNPEVKYRTWPETPAHFARMQLQMLAATAAALKPGGIVLYSVCTITHEETRGVTDQFLANRNDFELFPIDPAETPSPSLVGPDGFFSSFPPPGDEPLDGFFAARFRRRI